MLLNFRDRMLSIKQFHMSKQTMKIKKKTIFKLGLFLVTVINIKKSARFARKNERA